MCVCVCVCVCMCVCLCGWVWVCGCVSGRGWVGVLFATHVFQYTHIRMQIYTYTKLNIHTTSNIHTHTHTHTYTHTHIHTYTHTHIHTYTHTHIHTYRMYVYACVCVLVWIVVYFCRHINCRCIFPDPRVSKLCRSTLLLVTSIEIVMKPKKQVEEFFFSYKDCWSGQTVGATTLSITTFDITTLGITTNKTLYTA